MKLSPCVPSAAALLTARNLEVPFDPEPRRGEWEDLERWCREDPRSLAVRRYVGEAGVGKTRLLLEFADRLRDSGWDAGFADPLFPETLPAGAGPKLVVVDDAESFGPLDVLLRWAAGRRGDAPLRIVMLARRDADWWDALRERSPAPVRNLLAEVPFVIPPVEALGDRARLFEHAYRAFASRLGKPHAAISVPMDLSDARFGRVLYLQMAALAAVEGWSFTADTLLQEIVAREQRLWVYLRRQRASLEEDRRTDDDYERAATRAMAALTLRGGAESEAEAREIISRAGGPEEREFVDDLRGLYARPNAGMGEEAGRGPWIHGLEPALLGEAVVWQALACEAAPADLLEDIARGVSPGAIRRVFEVLGWISLDDSPAGLMHFAKDQLENNRLRRNWLELWIASFQQLLRGKLDERMEPALQAALGVGSPGCHSPLVSQLTSLLKEEGTVAQATHLGRILPKDAVTLRELSVVALQKRLTASPGGESEMPARAALLVQLSTGFVQLGHEKEALAAAEYAVGYYEILVGKDRDAYLPGLAAALYTRYCRLVSLRKFGLALSSLQTAVAYHRELLAKDRDDFQPDLVATLFQLSCRLETAGRREEAVVVNAELVEHYRELAAKDREAYLPGLAQSLRHQGFHLPRLEVLAAREEEVAIQRELVAKYRETFLPSLARSIHLVASHLNSLERPEEALTNEEEALTLWRELAAGNRAAYLFELARSLQYVAVLRRRLGPREEAISVSREAVRFYGELAEQQPRVYQDKLWTARSHLFVLLRDSSLPAKEDPDVVEAQRVLVQHCGFSPEKD